MKKWSTASLIYSLSGEVLFTCIFLQQIADHIENGEPLISDHLGISLNLANKFILSIARNVIAHWLFHERMISLK